MASQKRPRGTELIPNPFVKKRNLEWTLEPPSSTLSPKLQAEDQPDLLEVRNPVTTDNLAIRKDDPPTTADIEAGNAHVDDHLTHFSTHLSKYTVKLPTPPPLDIDSYAALYSANVNNPHGAHFVIHQHDHPVAGTHYDLRLQINETSSASWAIMYGLPGDPNSVRLNRNATETRVHSLWNHLIETASPETGSLLIWDTGTYSILPRKSKHAPRDDPSSQHGSQSSTETSTPSPQSLLKDAFHNRKIKLRLHGSKLPDPYVLNLRLTKKEDASGRAKSIKKPKTRRRRGGGAGGRSKRPEPETSSSEAENLVSEKEADDDEPNIVPKGEEADPAKELSALERELRELEDEEVRQTNAYPGALNTIGSIHQRRWYLSLERPACGFVERRQQGRSTWEKEHGDANSDTPSGLQLAKRPHGVESVQPLSYPFYVRGVEQERSVVTGRTAQDIMRDEGVSGFIRRKGWMPVLN